MTVVETMAGVYENKNPTTVKNCVRDKWQTDTKMAKL